MNDNFDVRKMYSESFAKQRDIAKVNNDEWLTTQLLKCLKLPAAIRGKLTTVLDGQGRTRATMADFRLAFPRFPIYTWALERIPLRDTASLQLLFPAERFLQHSLVRNFTNALTSESGDIAGRATAMLICWPGRLPVALHNLPITESTTPTVMLTLSDGGAVRLKLEPLKQLAEGLMPHLGDM